MAYRQKRKDQMLKKIKVAGTDLSDDQIETMIDEGKTEVFAKSILDQTQMARQQLTELQVRISHKFIFGGSMVKKVGPGLRDPLSRERKNSRKQWPTCA